MSDRSGLFTVNLRETRRRCYARRARRRDFRSQRVATRLIFGWTERLCAAPAETKAKGGLQFFFRRLLAGAHTVGAAR